MPAKAGIQRTSCASGAYWIPACAGMTSLGNRLSQARLVRFADAKRDVMPPNAVN